MIRLAGTPFAGNIRNRQADVVARQRDEIVKITTQLKARHIHRRQIHTRHLRRGLRNHPLLHLRRHLHLFFQRLRFDGLFQQPGVLNRRRRLGGHRFQQVDLQRAERLLAGRVHPQCADRPPLVAHSH